MNISSLRACLRIARRDARRSPGRSLLVLSMVALPVIGMTSADILFRSAQLDPTEKVTRELGRADVVISEADFGGAVTQNPDGTQLGFMGSPSSDGSGPPKSRSLSQLAAPVPGVKRTIPELTTAATVRTAGDGRRSVRWRALDYADPMLRGLVRQLDGRAPRGPGEVALTRDLARSLHKRVGDELRLTDGRPYRVTGIVLYPQALDAQSVLSQPAAAPPNTSPRPEMPPRLFVDTAEDVSWPQVLQLNEQGLVAVSRAVLLDPPAPSQIPNYDATYARNVKMAVAGLVLLVVGLATLEVVLLAGAAFAVGARRQRRALALVSVAGGEAKQVRSVVLAGGALLGALGGLLGVALGVVAGYAARGWFAETQGKALGHFELRPLELFGIALVGMLTGLLAAVVPARGAARSDVVAVLAGRAGTRATPLRVPVFGVALVGLGLALAVLGEGAGQAFNSAKLILAGTALVQIGAIVLTPAVVGLSGRLGRWLPLAPRLALRDAARHRGRTAPAVGAIMAAVAGSTALAVYAISEQDMQERFYSHSAREGTAIVQLASRPTEAQVEKIQGLVTSALPTRSASVVRSVGCNNNYDSTCSTFINLIAPQDAALCSADGLSCTSSSVFAGPMVGDRDLLRLVLGRAEGALETALAAGKVVVFHPGAVRDGKATFELNDMSNQGKPKTFTLPAVQGERAPGSGAALIPTSVAKRLGPLTPVGLLVDTTRMPTQAEEDSARAALEVAPVEAFVSVERGPTTRNGSLLLALLVGTTVITLGAAGIATGLAAADGRADMDTLAAVGAAPSTRKVLAGAQALTVAALGTALGVAVGFVPAVAYISRLPGYTVEVPWARLGFVVLVVPALAALLALAVTRSRLPVVRRVD